MTTVQGEQPVQTTQDKLKYDYSKGVVPYVPKEVDEFEEQAARYRRGELPDEVFMSYRVIRGVYGQRQPNVQMFRVKVPYGELTAEALDAFGHITREFAPLKKGHVTTRENVQMHFIPLEQAGNVMRLLGEVGLTTREACGNTVRNVTGCPEAGVAADEPFDVSVYASAFVRWFVRHPLTQSLPRKFKVAFASCSQDCVVTGIHDLGFIPLAITDENGIQREGFRVVTGGGTSIMPRIAYTLFDFVSVEEYLKVSEAVVRVFHRCNELRKNKARARLKFYIDRVGINAFRMEVQEELEQPWAQVSLDPTPLLGRRDEERETSPALVPTSYENRDPEFHAWIQTNVRPQKQRGYNVVGVKLPLGDITSDQFPALARIARQYASGRARTTNEQNLMFRWVPYGYLYDVWRELKQVGLGDAGVNEITDVMSCPGTDSCKLGITSSMGLGRAVKETVTSMAIDDPLVQSLHIKISGCPNGCGQHHIANLGFHGAAMKGEGHQVPAYEMFVAGSYGDGQAARIGKRIKTKVPAKRVPELVRHAIQFYQEHRESDEPFNTFVDRVGVEPFETIASQYSAVGPLNRENINTYIDWDETVLYKLERGEGECAV